MTQWQTKNTQSSTSDPFQNFRAQPMLGQGPANKHYVGRVVIEIWDDGSSMDDANKIIFTADAVDGNHSALLKRIAAALFKRSQGSATF
jgi:hypothetical protein